MTRVPASKFSRMEPRPQMSSTSSALVWAYVPSCWNIRPRNGPPWAKAARICPANWVIAIEALIASDVSDAGRLNSRPLGSRLSTGSTVSGAVLSETSDRRSKYSPSPVSVTRMNDVPPAPPSRR